MAEQISDHATVMGSRELRAGLATSLRRAQGGERFVITVDGKAVAQIGPLRADGAPTLADLIAVGMVDSPKRSDRPEPPDVSALATGLSTDRILEEVRGR